MWAGFKSLRNSKDGGGKPLKAVNGSLNVSEEYFSVFRTKSYADFFTKAQLLFNKPELASSSSFCHTSSISDVLLEPGQEAVATVLDATILSKNPDLKGLINKYFDISAEASKICSHLLTGIKQIQSNYQFIQRALAINSDQCYSPQEFKSVISELTLFNQLKNPFSNPNKHEFKLIHDRNSSVLHHLKSKKKKIARKIKLIKCFKEASGICVTAAAGAIATVTIILAAHTLCGLLMGPAILSLPSKSLKKKILNLRFLRCGFLRKLGVQLDVAAKGAFILNRDFDTMSRLVARLHDEIEHSKVIVQFCLERKEHRFPLQEVVKELRKSDVGFRKQLEELEEHVYLCLVTINRARSLVINEMTTSSHDTS